MTIIMMLIIKVSLWIRAETRICHLRFIAAFDETERGRENYRMERSFCERIEERLDQLNGRYEKIRWKFWRVNTPDGPQ
jgi:hypothetical protein